MIIDPDQTEMSVPTEEEAELALESSRQLSRLLGDKKRQFEVFIKPKGREEETITVPLVAFRLFANMLTEMAKGNAVTLVPVHAELSTEQAADVLNVSRPYLIKLLENDVIPFRFVGTHRRVRFTDVMAYKQAIDAKRHAVLDELAAEGQKLNPDY